MIAAALEVAPVGGDDGGVLAKLLAAAIQKHCADTNETVLQFAKRIGMPHQNLYEVLNRADDPTYDIGRKKLERLAEELGMEWQLVPRGDDAGSGS